MPTTLRITTFNQENLDDKPGQKPTLDERIALMRPQLRRLNVDILGCQEVNGQEEPRHPRRRLALAKRVIVPCEWTIPKPSRFSLLHHGQRRMIDHSLASRSLLAHYRGFKIHNKLLHDESVAFGTDVKFPESDHAPVIAKFELSNS